MSSIPSITNLNTVSRKAPKKVQLLKNLEEIQKYKSERAMSMMPLKANLNQNRKADTHLRQSSDKSGSNWGSVEKLKVTISSI